jgi:hypothetical protein
VIQDLVGLWSRKSGSSNPDLKLLETKYCFDKNINKRKVYLERSIIGKEKNLFLLKVNANTPDEIIMETASAATVGSIPSGSPQSSLRRCHSIQLLAKRRMQITNPANLVLNYLQNSKSEFELDS